jgi:hypothetical protein
MNLPSDRGQKADELQDDPYELSDAEVGRMVQEGWRDIVRRLANLGIDMTAADLVDDKVTDIMATRYGTEDDPSIGVTQKAMYLAARGELARAGRMLKRHCRDLDIRMGLERIVADTIHTQEQRKGVARKATAALEQQAAERQEEWMPIACELREKYPKLKLYPLAKRVEETIRKRGAMIDPPGDRTIRRRLAQLGWGKKPEK